MSKELVKCLKFVQGAVDKRGAELSHFKIVGGRIQGFNGSLGLSAPIPFDIDCIPVADAFVKAIAKCQDTISMTMTDAGRLSIKSGKFKAFINCLDINTPTPHEQPEGDFYNIDGEIFYRAMESVYDFIANEKSPHEWSKGVLLSDLSAFATNNAVITECWIGLPFPIRCNIPKNAIKEVLRIKEPPTTIQANDTSISFHYSDGRWIRSKLLAIDWPDITSVLSESACGSSLPNEFFTALEYLKPFADSSGRVYFNNDHMSTSAIRGQGATYNIPNLNCTGVYQIDMLMLLKNKVETIDFSRYPKPAVFFSGSMRGALTGMRE